MLTKRGTRRYCDTFSTATAAAVRATLLREVKLAAGRRGRRAYGRWDNDLQKWSQGLPARTREDDGK
jgi:hypothetical protein